VSPEPARELAFFDLDEPRFRALGRRCARVWARDWRPGEACLVALFGEMGAGKTTFVQAVVEGLADDDSVQASSPTYGLLHRYETKPPVQHMDLYRVAAAELPELGTDEIFETPGVTFVEWAEKAAGQLPEHRIELRIAVEPDERRSIRLQARGDPRWLRAIREEDHDE
jgi:tRNA threonylcarbamoyladenosine biosynthesis protein TsaE